MISPLPEATLGNNGPKVVRIGLGLMGLSMAYGRPKPDAERFALLDEAYNVGERFWDTADIYRDNEDLLGQWFKANPGKRENIFLATKFASTFVNGRIGADNSPEYVEKACARSLSRLGIPTIDLYYCHRLDGKTPIEKMVQAMAKLKQEGKIRYLGLSECSAESLRRAHKVHPITAVQMEYSPFSLEIESLQYRLLETCRELGVAVVAYSPIGRGMLSGNFRSPDDFDEGDFRKMAPRFSTENFPKNLELMDKITEMAAKKGVTAPQLSLAWLMAQGEDIFPIPGTTNPQRLKENIDSAFITLTDQEEREMRRVCNEAEVVGARYPEFFTVALFGDSPPLTE